jgi:deoxyxylulose-5-phosphate synthase
VSGDNHALTAFQTRQNGFIPVRYDAVDGQRQALGGRQLSVGQFCIARIVTRVALVVFGQLRRRYRKAATPLLNLLVTVFFSGFRFVEALQRTVVTLVQFPGFSTGSQA